MLSDFCVISSKLLSERDILKKSILILRYIDLLVQTFIQRHNSSGQNTLQPWSLNMDHRQTYLVDTTILYLL